MPPQWETGVLASLLGSLCGTLGGQLRICSLACAGRLAVALQASGWSFWVAGQGLGQVAILLAPATVAACVTFSGSLLCNALLAPLVLQEHLTRRHVEGILLLSVGGTAVTWASCHTGQDYRWPDLCELAGNHITWAFGGACLAVAAGLGARGASRRELDVVSFAFLFALCGSLDLLVTKFTLQLLRLQVIETDPASLPDGGVVAVFVALMFVMHAATFGFQVASVYYRNALESLPLFLGSGAIMQITLCGLFFREFDFTQLQAAAFCGGLALVLGGLFVTSHAAPARPSDGDYEEEEEEEPEEVGCDDVLAEPPCLAGSPFLSGSENGFRPPTARSPKHQRTHPPLGSMLLERSSSTLSSADYFMVGELQRSAMCFGSGVATKNLQCMPALTKPLLRSFSYPDSPMAGQEEPKGWAAMNSAPTFHSDPAFHRSLTVGAKPSSPKRVGSQPTAADAGAFPPVPEVSDVMAKGESRGG